MKRNATTAGNHSARALALRAFSALLACAALLAGMQQARATPDTERVESCSWDRPGHNPYMGDVVNAVDRYKDIPLAVRLRLKQRLADRNFDEYVTIERDSIKGQNYYESRITDMHFGQKRVCRNVSRAGWTSDMKQAGLVYCEANHCILVPTVCRNVSRIVRIASGATAITGQLVGFTAIPANLEEGPVESIALDYGTPDGLPPWVGGRPRPGPGIGDSLIDSVLNPPAGTVPGSPFGPGLVGTGPGLPLQPVPEPQEWLMYAVGLAVVGYVARRRHAAPLR